MTNKSQSRTGREGEEGGTRYHVQYDPKDAESILPTLISAVATASGRDPLELPSLYQSVDPDALAVMLASQAVRNLSFDYAGQTVTVFGQGSVVVS